MKHAASAQRLVFILIFVALTSTAFAAPPEHSHGEPPPFNEEDCVFESGRTTCEIVERLAGSEASGAAKAYRTDEKCADGSTLYNLKQKVSVVISTTRVVFRGTSDVVESFEVFTDVLDEETIVVGTLCL